MMETINQTQQQIIESNLEQMKNIGNDVSEDTENSQDDNQISKIISDGSNSTKKSLIHSDEESIAYTNNVSQSKLNKHATFAHNFETLNNDLDLSEDSEEDDSQSEDNNDNSLHQQNDNSHKETQFDNEEKRVNHINPNMNIADNSQHSDTLQINNNAEKILNDEPIKSCALKQWSNNEKDNKDGIENLNDNSKNLSEHLNENKKQIKSDEENSNGSELKSLNLFDSEDEGDFKFGSNNKLEQNNRSGDNSSRSSTSPSSLDLSSDEDDDGENPVVENDNDNNIMNTDENANLQGDFALSDSDSDSDTADAKVSPDQTLSPKMMNGDHKTLQETENTNNEAVITQSGSADKLKHIEGNSTGSFKIQDKVDNNSFERQSIAISNGEELIISNIKTSTFGSHSHTLNHSLANNNDDNSRSSVDTVNSFSTSTSASDQLVIDQPTEMVDLDTPTLKSSEPSKEKKVVKPLKVSLKRKHNNSQKDIDVSAPKQPHLEVERENKENAMLESQLNEIEIVDAANNEQSAVAQNQPIIEVEPVANMQTMSISSSGDGMEGLEGLVYKSYPSSKLSTPHRSWCIYCRKPFKTSEKLNDHMPLCVANHPVVRYCEEVGMRKIIMPPIVQSDILYKCKSCTTIYEKWNFFFHMCNEHKSFICVYCNRFYSTAEKLSLHLEIKHDIEQQHYQKDMEVLESIAEYDDCYLMCCTCQHITRVSGELEHNCTDFIITCDMCGQKGRHSNDCKAHPNVKRFAKMKKKKTIKSMPMSVPGPAPVLPLPSSSTVFSSNQIGDQIVPQPMHTTSSVDCDKYPILSIIPPSDAVAMQPIQSSVLPSIQYQKEQQLILQQQKKIMEQYQLFEQEKNILLQEQQQTQPQPQSQQEPQSTTLTDSNSQTISAPVNESVPDMWEHETVTHFENNEILANQQLPNEPSAPIPPDRMDTSTSSFIEPLVVPKMKLCVPKEFQKSVNSDISSFGSDEEEDYDQGADESVQSAANETINVERSKTDIDIGDIADDSSKDVDEDFVDQDLEIQRLAEEIKRTQMDIEMARIQRHTSKKAGNRKHQFSERSQDPDNAGTNWSPTPPTSPHSRDFTPYESINKRQKAQTPSTKPEISQVASNDAEMAERLPTNGHVDDGQEETPAPELKLTGTDDTAETGLETEKVTEQIESAETVATAPLIEVVHTEEPKVDEPMVAKENVPLLDVHLLQSLENYDKIELLRTLLSATVSTCVFCNHARRIAVNGKQLALHMLAEHRFKATVEDITADKLQRETIVEKLKGLIPSLETDFFNLTNFNLLDKSNDVNESNERVFECFRCSLRTTVHKEMYLHNRKEHLKSALLCLMCRSSFYSFSELLCHLCPGTPVKSISLINYRCCFCNKRNIPSAFRLMVHLRKEHSTCDICLEDCGNQYVLSNHVWKHKLHHLCYRCSMTYRSKEDINKHLFWKHGTEGAKCKRCLQKRWRHVYHFCTPPERFECDECNLSFSKAMYLNVHQRLHNKDLRYACTEDQCEEKFVSRRLLLKHIATHQLPAPPPQKEPSPEVSSANELEEGEIRDDIDIPQEVDKDKHPDKKAEADVKENESSRKKKKKDKNQQKKILDDLNFRAPNLSESDSSDDSDTPSNATFDDMIMPKPILSPLSEGELENEDNVSTKAEQEEASTVAMGIWSNLLKDLKSPTNEQTVNNKLTDYTEKNYPRPKHLHVDISDHDYCQRAFFLKSNEKEKEKEHSNSKPSTSKSKVDSSPSSSNSDSSSSDSDSSSNSSSSKSSSSSSSSTSDSSSDSDSSAESTSSKKVLVKKVQKKRSGKRSESSSPLKKHQEIGQELNSLKLPIPEEPKFKESDFETAESETDEDFYDEHPQKIDEGELARKRAQLMARTRLSPSHNFDILENSRPSTPSLPEDVAFENRFKPKKKKQDRKSPSHSHLNNGIAPALMSMQENHHNQIYNAALSANASYGVAGAGPATPYNYYHNSCTTAMETATISLYPKSSLHTNVGTSHAHRMSEGSSCSEQDGSLKRSKRQRRPNKFYGYEPEDLGDSSYGTPIMIGTRALKPTPPPNLVWCKEDLPSPSKSILKSKSRHSKSMQYNSDNTFASPGGSPLKKKKIRYDSPRQRQSKKSKVAIDTEAHFPPIPTLKIRPSQLSIHSEPTRNSYDNSYHASTLTEVANIPYANHISSSREKRPDTVPDIDSSESSSSSDDEPSPTTNEESLYNLTPKAPLPPKQRFNRAALNQYNTHKLVQKSVEVAEINPRPTPKLDVKLMQAAQLLPNQTQTSMLTPQVKVFGTTVPPALLPNPNPETLEYFRQNNIRYPIRPPAGARKARDSESVYCYCRCPYDEVSEMIACDGDNCMIEWFHFECIGIMMAPQGPWYCPECRPKYMPQDYHRVIT